MEKAERAFLWIIGLLEDHNIPYQISGGLAAKVYGSERELADIDIGVPDSALTQLLPLVKEYVTYGPERYVDEQWDLRLLTLEYEGQEIDLSGEDTAKIYDAAAGKWVADPSDISTSRLNNVFGRIVPVVDKDALIAYKTMLGREVDLLDLASMN